MKKNHLLFVSLIFLGCLVVFSCRRDIENLINDQVVSSKSLENARIWHARNLNKSSNALRPLWSDSWTVKTTKGELLVVPAP